MLGADQCPRCGSLARIEFRQLPRPPQRPDPDPALHYVCVDCSTIWETFDAAKLADPHDRLSPFKTLCDNCAFRRGSPERGDVEKWEALMERLWLWDGIFYCHKGTPVSTDPHDGQSHVHPCAVDGKPDTKQMRPCAGWLMARANPRVLRRLL